MITFKNILDSSFEEQLEIREWRNNEEVRKYMFNPQIISLESHISWLNSLKENNEMKIFYIILNNEKIGINSLRKRSNFGYEWGIYLNNKVPRGKGIGKQVGKEFIKYVFEILEANFLEYEVLEKNKASIKLALSLGLTSYKEELKEIDNNIEKVIYLKINQSEWRKNE